MTVEAVAALAAFQDQFEDLVPSLSGADWVRPSACAGWRVRDVVAHLGAGARSMIDPLEMPEDRLPLPTDREREHDVHVDLRRSWPIADVIDEFMTFGRQRLQAVRDLQEEPAASNEITLPGLGTYPMHAAANGLAFDYYCHLHHDLLSPRGPIAAEAPAVTHAQMCPVVQWMMWGLPQMQGPELDEVLLAPTTLVFTGPGESTWTVIRPDPASRLVVEEGGGGEVTVTTSATDFVSWGTSRTPWRDAVSIEGDRSLVIGFLSTLDII